MHTLTKILIYLAVWKRPHITELCFVGINRLKKMPQFNIEALAVISEPEMIPLCEKHGIKWVMYKNDPLGEKKNFGLQACSKIEFDYLLEIGSDDLVLNELLESYIPHIGFHDFFGMHDVAYIESDTGMCRRLISRHSTYGAGRMIKRSVLEKANWKLWNDKINKGMDNNSVLSLQRLGFSYVKVNPMDFPGLIDIKSDENIWGFNYFLGVPYDKNILFEKISDEEVQMIESYVTVEN